MAIDVSSLASQIDGTVLTPGDTGYDESIKRWASNAERKAAVVVFATSSTDVAAALAFAKKTGIEVAVSGGKHSASGASSSEGGLVIDLSKMRNVKVDTTTNRIIAQGGCLWADVDTAAAKYDLATVGGTVNHTGIGGLTLGGGYGYLSGQYGMVVDNLRNVEIVLASGEIVQANVRENPDLFWAIRGGGCNFGVVTEFTYQAYPHAYPVYAGMIIYTPDHLEAIVETFNKWFDTDDGKNPKAAFFVGTAQPPPHFKPTLIVVVFYDGDEIEGRRIFKPFFDLNPVADLTRSQPYVELNGMINPLVEHGSRRYLKATALRHLTVPILRGLFESFVELTQHIGPDAAFSVCLFEYFSRRAINSLPDDATAFHNRGEWFNVTISPNWGNRTEFDEYARNWVHTVVDKLVVLEKADTVIKEGEEVVGKRAYFNGSMGDEKSSQVFGANYPRLRELKRKYDPDFVFKKWFPIFPANVLENEIR